MAFFFQTKFLLEKKNTGLDSYFIHMYIFIYNRSSSILGRVHQLLWELRPFFNFIFSKMLEKLHRLDSFLDQVRFCVKNPPIIMRVIALFHFFLLFFLKKKKRLIPGYIV